MVSIILATISVLAPETLPAVTELVNQRINSLGRAAYSGIDPEFTACVSGISADVETGRRSARQWLNDGGGPPAQYCLAIGDFAAGFPKLAAVRFTELAEMPNAGSDETKSRVYASAALSFLDANKAKEALLSLKSALNISPDLSDLHLVAAKVYAANEQWEAVVNAVGKSIEAGLINTEGFILRATAHRALGKNRQAAEDIVQALKREPENLDALVIRGELIQGGIEIRARYEQVDTPN
ncbi:MAG: hypothetical protein AAF720_07275 [Pseudomonadota bacterium]